MRLRLALLMLIALPTFSSIDEAQLAGAIELQIVNIDQKIQDLRTELVKKTRFFHVLSTSPDAPQFAWDETRPADSSRAQLATLAKVEIRNLVKMIESLERRREELSNEREWERVKVEELATLGREPKKKQNLEKPFLCKATPVTPLADHAAVKQGFGRHQDADTGVEWQSSGWWITDMKGLVKACAAGNIAFVGKIPGRGHVVMVDHGQGLMTLYANLTEDSVSGLIRGAKVLSGEQIGVPLERMYFEVRKAGQAIDPRQVFAPTDLVQFRL
jgi:septal ring factor EnvC (AmiA/AmiB activator)